MPHASVIAALFCVYAMAVSAARSATEDFLRIMKMRAARFSGAERRGDTEVVRATKRARDTRLNMTLFNTTLFNTTLLAALLLAPLGSAAATTSITRTVKVTKTVTVRTVTKRTIIRTASHRAFHRHVYRARAFVFVRRFHPESCFLTPDLVVALDALGPYCDSPRGWRRVVVRY